MNTSTNFNNMLNEHLHYELMWEELQKRDYMLKNIAKNDEWKGGTLPVPFYSANATSYRYGALTNENDIAQYKTTRGEVTAYKEIWGSMLWEGTDLYQHDGKFKEASFIKNLPDQIEMFLDGMKQQVSLNLLIGSHFAGLTAIANAATGIVDVDRVERFTPNQKVVLDDGINTVTAYVHPTEGVDIDADQVKFVTTRGGTTVVDFSNPANTITAVGKIYYEGAEVGGTAFTSLRESLLSLANGGSANLYGVSKLSTPYLQAPNIDGSAITGAADILDNIFDAWTRVQQLGKGHATHAIMSYKNLGSVMKKLESGAGAYRHVETKVSVYGYTEIVVVGVKGQLTLVGVHEMEDDLIYFIDWTAMKLHSNEYFRKHVDPDGNQYHKLRKETGYQYICDISFYGEFVLHAPCKCGVMYGISY